MPSSAYRIPYHRDAAIVVIPGLEITIGAGPDRFTNRRRGWLLKLSSPCSVLAFYKPAPSH